MKEAFYFPHFCNARHDRKIKRLRKELGLEGYGIFFMLLEVLREQTDLRYPIDDIDLLADELGASEQKVRVVICNYQLFKIETTDNEEMFFSPKLISYLQPYFKMREQRRIAGQKSAQARKLSSQNSTDVQRSFNGRSTVDEQSKVKESKVKEIKVDVVTPEKFYQDNFGLITEFIAEDIKNYIDDDIEEALIIRSMEMALKNNVRTWNYASAILKHCLSRDIKTLQQYEAHELERQKSKVTPLHTRKSGISEDSMDEIWKEINDGAK